VLYHRNLKLETSTDVYEPAEDSFLLADSIGLRGGESFLDVGTGTGIVALAAAEKASRVLGVDVNPAAIELARKNAEANKIKNAEFRLSDLFSGVKEKFDVVAFNPPYVPVSESGALAKSWSGGEGGLEVAEKFLSQVRNHLNAGGRFLILLSSINDPAETARKHPLSPVAELKIPFETLFVFEGHY
jgi:release factor glutamine methyltransferase